MAGCNGSSLVEERGGRGQWLHKRHGNLKGLKGLKIWENISDTHPDLFYTSGLVGTANNPLSVWLLEEIQWCLRDKEQVMLSPLGNRNLERGE